MYTSLLAYNSRIYWLTHIPITKTDDTVVVALFIWIKLKIRLPAASLRLLYLPMMKNCVDFWLIGLVDMQFDTVTTSGSRETDFWLGFYVDLFQLEVIPKHQRMLKRIIAVLDDALIGPEFKISSAKDLASTHNYVVKIYQLKQHKNPLTS